VALVSTAGGIAKVDHGAAAHCRRRPEPLSIPDISELRTMMAWEKDLPTDMVRAMRLGDTDYLYENYNCECCCSEHTSSGCPARQWGACRGQETIDEQSWAAHYREHHGMTEAEFFAWTP
jgi:hypothetical protein